MYCQCPQQAAVEVLSQSNSINAQPYGGRDILHDHHFRLFLKPFTNVLIFIQCEKKESLQKTNLIRVLISATNGGQFYERL